MNVLLNFVIQDIITLLEEQFISHEAEIQAAFLNEVGLLSQKIGEWLTEKLSSDTPK